MTDNTVRVRVAGSQFRFDREQFTRDDTLEVLERVAAKHPNTLEPVDSDDGDEEDDDIEPIPEDELDPHPSELTVDELETRLGNVDDLELLHGILEAEQSNKKRDTAVDSITGRLAELEG
ncbi:hypothetical protein [Natrarchaeobaculum sulfurireducens]|uniref:Uncharacterized protein n=1 Tax=Natrarchaeobaculum sulfurireducens TaxID=2044521 RepID=A0A346PHJ6_9EURY|nr:hypothetical protein [Natrarchaeobaculum sulfurireducens]AXR78991.1 hypothetical protein AArc1_2678 [Natrarchaeobaculum sulfurireducens]